jgi:membrane-bound lytic murein transglycosylase D
MLDRGEDYRKMITAQLAEHLMPPELFNLAMIESGFVARAKSDAEAVGIWQFIPTTGTLYGLHVDAYSDDRNHPLLATQAAIRHLLYLRKRFKSWNLVLAAYNAGPERIAKAIRRGKSDNFWELARKHVLPSETMDYIPKVMAAVIISSHYEKFGFRRPVAANPYPELAAVRVKPGSSLAQLSRNGKIELAMLKHFNPQLKTGALPPHARRAEVWVPAREAQDFRVALATKSRSKPKTVASRETESSALEPAAN